MVAQRDGQKNREHKERNLQRSIDEVENGTIDQSKRNKTLFKYACSLRAKSVPEDELRERVHRVNREQCQVPLEDSEVERIIGSALRYEPGTSRNPLEPPTQAEIAEDMRTMATRCQVCIGGHSTPLSDMETVVADVLSIAWVIAV